MNGINDTLQTLKKQAQEYMENILQICNHDLKKSAQEYKAIERMGETSDAKVLLLLLGPVPTTVSSHLLADFPPLFVGISLLASWQAASTPPQLAKNRRKIWLLPIVGTGPSYICHVRLVVKDNSGSGILAKCNKCIR